MQVSLTVPYRFAIPVLQGKGLTLDEARRKLVTARTRGVTLIDTPGLSVVVLYENRKYTIR